MGRKGGRRELSAGERALWQKVVEKATPLPDRPAHAKPSQKPKLRTTEDNSPSPKESLRAFRIGESAQTQAAFHSLSRDPMDSLSLRASPMDRKLRGRMNKGKLEPEDRIDLHGKTLAAAHPALVRFILDAHARGYRLVLVITGKGKDRDDGGPIPSRKGALRHEVPQWLFSGPLSGAVMDVAPAHRRHGGSGAYYVYLRRRR